jgi:predicted O-methyltransferase YrrM
MTATHVMPAKDPQLGTLRHSAFDLCQSNQIDAAQTLLDRALQLSPDDCELLCDRATLHLHAGRIEPAIAAARAALAVAPRHDTSTYTLALALAAANRSDEARFLFAELTQGLRGETFARAHPALASLADQALRCLSPRAAPEAMPASTRFSASGAAKYDLTHLVQPAKQSVGGPIQDDEALLLYALVRVMRVRRVLEVGGLNGYSARNFLAALGDETGAAVYTCDINPVPSQAANHFVLTKDCAQIQVDELHGRPLDLIFFDAHALQPQLALLDRLQRAGLLTADTVLALHDTNLHPHKTAPWSYALAQDGQLLGYVHQAAEREMVNQLHQRGWDALSLHLRSDRADPRMPIRHGISLMQRFRHLAT